MSGLGYETPQTRALVTVLRESGRATAEAVSLLVCICGPAVPAGEANAYVNVEIQGVVVKVPRIAGAVVGAPGKPAYVLQTRSLMLYLGTVTT